MLETLNKELCMLIFHLRKKTLFYIPYVIKDLIKINCQFFSYDFTLVYNTSISDD